MAEDQASATPKAPAEPLFVLELGANGGTFAPTTAAEMRTWLDREVRAGEWVRSVGGSNVKSFVDSVYGYLVDASNLANEAAGFEQQRDVPRTRSAVDRAQAQVSRVFTVEGWPHSTSTSGHRVADLRIRSVKLAMPYLYATLLNPQGQNVPFGPASAEEYLGLIEGLADRYGLAIRVSAAQAAQQSATEELRTRLEGVLGLLEIKAGALHREYESLAQGVSQTGTDQQTQFAELMSSSRDAHAKALEQHESGFESVRTAYKEAMALRAPVEYWATRGRHHRQKAASASKWMFTSMFLLAFLLLVLANLLFNIGTKPDPWKAGIVALVGVVGVWAVRLLVRMYLSHEHLANDADERETMVMTYLALIESGKMPSDEDRKLVLTPLFRPASDGIVKDEGLPHPILEALTRGGRP